MREQRKFKTFNNLGEMQPYFVEETNTYVFTEKEMRECFDEYTKTYDLEEVEERLNIEITFDLEVKSNIYAGNIHALDITALDIEARDIFSEDITALNVKASDVVAEEIKVKNLLDVRSVKSERIQAEDIDFYTLCITEGSIFCKSIKGRHFNSLYYCLDGGIHLGGANIYDGKYHSTERSETVNR